MAITGEVTSALLKGLSAHLKANMPSLRDMFDSWPAPNQKLNYPSGSITMGNPVFTPLTPYIVSRSAQLTTGPDTGKYPVQRVVGEYEFKLQLDIWCRSKPERSQIYKEFFLGFNNNSGVYAGLSLQLADYFNEWVRFSIDDIQFVDDEESIQRDEWRLRISLLADSKAIIEKNELLIATIENKLDTPATIDPPAALPADTLII